MFLAAWAELSGCTYSPPPETNSHGGAQLHSGLPVDAPTSMSYVSSCNIETLHDAPASGQAVPVQQGAALNLSGWVVDEATHQSPIHVFILVQSAESREYWWAPISGRLPRQDVAQSRNSTLLSGFRATADTSVLPPGEYLVMILFWQNGPSQVCDNGRRIMITSQ
jgi:hypothetical protein